MARTPKFDHSKIRAAILTGEASNVIAERVGCAPSTVGMVRAKMRAEGIAVPAGGSGPKPGTSASVESAPKQPRLAKSVTESAALYEPIQVPERDRMRARALLASTGAMDLAEMLGVA